jgi:hypothetical protein
MCIYNIYNIYLYKYIQHNVNVAGMGERRGVTGFWWGNLRERDHWGDPGVDGRIILR